MEMSMSRKGGNVKADVKVADALAHHHNINEEEIVQYAKDFDFSEFLKGYAETTNTLQSKADSFMVTLRKILRGESLTKAPDIAPTPTIFTKCAAGTVTKEGEKVIVKSFTP
jgi:hypothetical protein